MKSSLRNIILASSSGYKNSLLANLGMPFEAISPDVDEQPLPEEEPKALTLRLAELKATAISERFDNAFVIGSDQVASCENQIIGKPGSLKGAVEQLSFLQGKEVLFFTSVAVSVSKKRCPSKCVLSKVVFRNLTKRQIQSYVQVEKPLDCAGSFKAEALGITLFEAISSNDPTALIGLPLIALTTLLIEFGVNPVDYHSEADSR